MDEWRVSNPDGVVEAVSREEFFRRTTPNERMFWDRCQSESGGASIYADAEEWAADAAAIDIAAGIDREGAEALAQYNSQFWRADYSDPLPAAV